MAAAYIYGSTKEDVIAFLLRFEDDGPYVFND
jgi:hypothetical protein